MRRMIAALLGALASAACLILLSYAAFVVFTALMAVPLMLIIAFGKRSLRQLGRDVLLSWLSIILLNGVAIIVFQMTGVQSLTIYSGILVLLVASALVRTLMRSLKKQKLLMQVVLCHGEHSVSCVGLYDSGNQLELPVTGEPVHIISPALLMSLNITESPKREIYYSSLGNENGRIGVMQIEQMHILTDGKELCYRDAWVGCAGAKLMQNKDYQIILHSSVHLKS